MIVSIVKDKICETLSDMNNYMAIAVSKYAVKMFESVLEAPLLLVSDADHYQFGNKPLDTLRAFVPVLLNRQLITICVVVAMCSQSHVLSISVKRSTA